MKLFLFILGLILIAVAIAILRPMAERVSDIGGWDLLLGGLALSFLGGGLKMLWWAIVLPR
ncbi:MAG: hypothetical protein IM516_01310 [Pseudanabaena sp. M158S2SP1A06QC]|jgi:hypothetical protein|nr:hypothetical protein [Pseudanabaena sp. M158S2SP1A06QC]MCA6624353.1 hypothetical protein [Pseudanabaena sp. M165S2SP1A06QC]